MRAALGLLLALSAAAAVAAAMPAAAGAVPTPAPSQVVDGPDAGIQSLDGMSIARDGTGGLVYLKQVGGTAHVFVSRIIAGSFGAPEELDAALSGESSQPVIAASDGGLVAVAFVNGGTLYAITRTAGTGWVGPVPLAGGAANPAISMTIFGKAYLAFTAPGAGGHDVRAAYFASGRWALEPAPLDAQAADDAGSGGGRPAVAAANDGVGIVAWGENGHIYTRRVWATSPSVVFEQADPASVGGWGEVTAGVPSISAGGDSSYAAVAYQETFASGSASQSRVLVSRLQASQFNPPQGADGLSTPGGSGAGDPQVALNEYGRGFVTSARTDSNDVVAAQENTNALQAGIFGVNSLPNASPSYPAPGIAGLASTLIAWQHDPGLLGSPEIRTRYAADGHDLGPELVLSNPARGPTDAADGLIAGGDTLGDAVVAWVQGPAGARQIVVGQMYQPLGSMSPLHSFSYLHSSHPTLSWQPPKALWGPIVYTVTVDNVPVGQTTSTSFRVPVALREGVHSWRVSAINPAHSTTTMRLSSFWIDTVKPTVTLKLTGQRQPHAALHASVGYNDTHAPAPRGTSSGVATVFIGWGDGHRDRITHGKSHVYRRAGRYTITVTVTDRAGNVARLTRTVQIGKVTKHSKRRQGTRRQKHSTRQQRSTQKGRGR